MHYTLNCTLACRELQACSVGISSLKVLRTFFKILYVGLKHKGGRLSCGDRFYVGASVGMNSSLDATDLQQPGLESLRTIVTVFELVLVVYGVSEKRASDILRTGITHHISS